MTQKKRLIPFHLTPAAWGLTGQSYKLAEAEYYYDGEELDRAKAKINASSEEDLRRRLLEVDYQYDRISQYDYEKRKLELEELPEDQKKVRLAELDFQHERITENELERLKADAYGEPWVGVIKSEFDADASVNGLNFELDWNEHFVTMLENNGYTGVSDQAIVEQWFNDVCANVAMEQGILEDLTEAANEVHTTGTTRKRVDDSGKAEYS